MKDFILAHIGEIAGLVSFSAYTIYIISTFRGKTRPSRSTWWILSLVGILILASSYSSGTHESLWIQLSYVIGPLIIGIQSIKYGHGSRLELIDKICLLGALVSGLLWIIFNSPFVALLGSILVDCIGLIPTITKSYINPEEEDPVAWSIELFASILNAIGITVWFSLSEKDWIYALYLLIANGIVVTLLWRKPKKITTQN